jgi:hypothetical protein
MMYNTTYTCTYSSHDIFLDTDKISDTDKDFIKNVLYRNDLMHIFNLEDFDNEEELFVSKIENIYEKIKNYPEIVLCIEKLANNNIAITNNIIDLTFGFILLFSFDYLYIIHPCICDFLETGEISEINIQKLKIILE